LNSSASAARPTTRAALKRASCPAGGIALLLTIPSLANLSTDDQKTGIDIVRRALVTPTSRLSTMPAMTARS